MKVQDVDVAAEQKRRRFRLTLITVGSVIVLVGVGALAWYITPPAMPQTVEEAKALVTSARFERMNKEQKRPYYDVIREQFGSLDREERRELMKNDEEMRGAMRDAWGSKMEDFGQDFLLSTPEERPGLFAGMMGGRRPGPPKPEGENKGERPQRPEGQSNADRPKRPEGGGEGGDRNSEDRKRERGQRINDRITSGNAQTNQAMGEIFIQIRQQREQAGQ